MTLRPLLLLLALPLAIPGMPAAAQDKDLVTIPAIPTTYKPQKTAWGEPDLSGLWPIDHLNMTPFQRTEEQGNRYFLTDEEFAARQKQINAAAGRYDQEDKDNKLGMGAWLEAGEANRRTSFLISPANGRLPAKTAEGERRSALMRSSYRPGQAFDWTSDFDSWDRCISRGLPASMFTINYNNGIRLWQAPGLVAIQLEMVHETRIIPTDGRPGIPHQIGQWLGESRGHWENGNTLWRRDSSYQFFEYACHEGNVQIRGYISSSRAERGLQPVKAAQ